MFRLPVPRSPFLKSPMESTGKKEGLHRFDAAL
jgi:hypothetical protein